MTYAPGRHIYLAAPFFNEEQKELCSFIEGLATPLLPIYSPRLDGGVLTPDASNEERKAIFDSNCLAIDMSAWMLAVIDNFDTGTIWEMGYAHPRVQTLAYSDVAGRGLNVMLAGSAQLGFVSGREALAKLFGSANGIVQFPNNTWPGEIH